MLTVEISVANPDGVLLLDFVDDKSPNGRPVNFRIPIRWNGLAALKAAIDPVVERKVDASKVIEKAGGKSSFAPIKK